MRKEVEKIVIRFSGDSGDGMQLTGTQFSNTSALMGNDIATFPDYPAEIRAPQGTIAGVSGFQVHFGSTEVSTSGDEPDVLVAMNPAALKANLASLKKGGIIIVDTDAFTEKNLQKVNYDTNPLETSQLTNNYQIIKAPISTQTLEALKDVAIDTKSKTRCKNFYALGITYFIFSRDLNPTIKWIEDKFKKSDLLKEANIKAVNAGYNFAVTIEAVVSTYKISPAKIKPGKYRQINGNTSLAYGFIQASLAAKRPLFLGSYPITPATDILQELAKHKNYGVVTFQAEDEIAGICSAIGASYAGSLALTTSSGPGIALKSEAIGLAVMMELPLVIVNVQRGGPSTGLPTKTEQSDLYQAILGRNGECPVVVLAASRPNDCFEMAFNACKIALEHMVPVFLLSDGYIANGAEPWLLPDLDKNFNKITTRLVTKDDIKTEKYLPYDRDESTLARSWAIPGTPGLEHRIGGLEKAEKTGNVSYDPVNHQKMCTLRKAKVEKVANFIPEQTLEGDSKGDILVLSWGGTYGATHSAVKSLRDEGKKISLAHLRYLNPFPRNLGEILKNFKRVFIPELNFGQLKFFIDSKYHIESAGYNKMQGLPFTVAELVSAINKELENIKK